MKKILLAIGLASVLGLSNAQALVTSVTVLPGTMTNLFTGYGRITQIVISSTSLTNTTGILVDTPTNSLVYTTLAYSNIVSYLTNVPAFYTNYFGVVTTLTNSTTTSPGNIAGTSYALVDVTNSVPSSTNNAFTTYGLSVAGNSTVVIATPAISVIRGAWFTNSTVIGSSGINGATTVTLTYTPN